MDGSRSVNFDEDSGSGCASWAYFVMGCTVVVMSTILYFVSAVHSDRPLEEWGQIGDMFGGLNAAFSGLAFAGLLFALYLQRKELALQRQELALTRQELAKTASANESTAQLVSRQVELLEEQVELLEEQARERRSESRPIFALRGHGYNKKEKNGWLDLENLGADARELVALGRACRAIPERPVPWKSGDRRKVEFRELTSTEEVVEIRLDYINRRGFREAQILSFDRSSGHLDIRSVDPGTESWS